MASANRPPSRRRLRRARARGDVPVSRAAVGTAGLLLALLATPAALAAGASRASLLIRQAITAPESITPTGAIASVLGLTVPLLAVAAAGSLAIGLLQTGAVLSPAPLLSGWSQERRTRGHFAEAGWNVAQALVLALAAAASAIVVFLIGGPALAGVVGSPERAGALAQALGLRLVWLWLAVAAILSLFDVGLTRMWYRKRLQMTPAEWREELRQTEGHPELKRARARAHNQLLAGNASTVLANATILVVDPFGRVVALGHATGSGLAPELVLATAGELGRECLRIARALHVPVVEHASVPRGLFGLAPGARVPPRLYESVAQLLREATDRGSGTGAHPLAAEAHPAAASSWPTPSDS